VIDSFTPGSIIAGRIPVVRGHEREAVFHAAASLLDTENIRFVMTVQENNAWYLAAPASEFGNHPDSTTPLEAALPGSAEHKGDGAYVTSLAGSNVLTVIKSAEGLKTFFGRDSQVERFIQMEEATQVFRPSAGVVRWESFDGMHRRVASRLVNLLVLVGLAANLICGAAWTGASIISGNEQAAVQAALAAQTNAMRATAAALNAVHADVAILRTHAYLVKEVMLDPKGQIKRFQFENGQISWAAALQFEPTAEKLRELGPGVKVERMRDGRVLLKKEG
jgi:hypothetical protein